MWPIALALGPDVFHVFLALALAGHCLELVGPEITLGQILVDYFLVVKERGDLLAQYWHVVLVRHVC